MTPTGPTGDDETAAPLTFTKSGGVAGIDATLTIDADGTVSLRSGHPPSVEEHELEVPAPERRRDRELASSIDYPERPPPEHRVRRLLRLHGQLAGRGADMTTSR